MYRSLCVSALVAAVLCVLSNGAMAQTQLKTCADATSMDFNSTFAGIWYEAAVSPASSTPLSCVAYNVTMMPNNMTMIQVTYANMPAMLWKNQTVDISGNLTAFNNGLNLTYNLLGLTASLTTVKLLDINTANHAILCGYSNATDPTTSFGIVLTRQRLDAQLGSYEALVSANYTNFNSSMTNITQTDACYTNAGVTTIPYLSAVLAAIYAILKIINY